MLISGAGAWVIIALALITDDMTWMLLAVSMFAISMIADYISDEIYARARRFHE